MTNDKRIDWHGVGLVVLFALSALVACLVYAHAVGLASYGQLQVRATCNGSDCAWQLVSDELPSLARCPTCGQSSVTYRAVR